jgi:GT2 family glycosyltransferase
MHPLAIARNAVRMAWRHRRDLHKLVFYVRVNGVRKALNRIGSSMRGLDGADRYTDWIAAYDTLTPTDLKRLAHLAEALPRKPVISVVMPVYDPPAEALRRAIESVRQQIYPHWQLCIADDASPSPHVGEILRAAAAEDSRIRVTFRPGNGHVSAASNSALALAGGEFVALLDHDDELTPHALYVVAAELNARPNADLLYSDEDKLDDLGRRTDPYFKPDWDPELFLGQNYLNHLSVYRRSLVEAVGGFREGFEGSQDYDLALRVIERTSPDRIRHLPFVLYHWRIQPGAATLSSTQLGRATEAARRAVAEHLERTGSPAKVAIAADRFQRIIHPLPEPPPLVSLLVPTRDAVGLVRQCLDGLLHGTDYPNLEVLILDNDSCNSETLAYFEEVQRDPRVRVLPQPGPFNFSAINNAGAAVARGSVIGFINNDIKVIGRGWLREMVAHALRPEVGAVGAKLRYGDDTIQHGGVILGIGGVGGHAHRRVPADEPGRFSRLMLVQSFSAVTAACLVMRKALFEQVGGFDAEHLAVAFNDVDLCLKLRARGLGVVWTPHAELYHLESVSRGGDLDADKRNRFRAESLHMRETWGPVLDADPFYNPNLTLHAMDYGLSFPPRIKKEWRMG